jgi:ABC-2 type transport system ATP-binding protein
MIMDVDAPFPVVEINGLRVSYGRIEAVRGVDLTVAPGELVALLGANGAGKSTLMNALLGLVPPAGGTVLVAGRTPRRAVRRGDVGAMLQLASLPEGAKVGEVVGLVHALHRTGPTVSELLDLAGLSGLADREVSALSGGQAQRVRFAAALAGRPRLLVLDEPTTGMDVESRAVFWDAVRRIAEGRTAVLFATHYLEEADRFADRVVMIAAGRVVAQGAPRQLKADRSAGELSDVLFAVTASSREH